MNCSQQVWCGMGEGGPERGRRRRKPQNGVLPRSGENPRPPVRQPESPLWVTICIFSQISKYSSSKLILKTFLYLVPIENLLYVSLLKTFLGVLTKKVKLTWSGIVFLLKRSYLVCIKILNCNYCQICSLQINDSIVVRPLGLQSKVVGSIPSVTIFALFKTKNLSKIICGLL